jgi:hypothetical protein
MLLLRFSRLFHAKSSFQLIIDGKLFVAKQFFKMGLDSVDTESNTVFLNQELIHLKQALWFWQQFQKLVKEKGVDICRGDCLLAFLSWIRP